MKSVVISVNPVSEVEQQTSDEGTTQDFHWLKNCVNDPEGISEVNADYTIVGIQQQEAT